MFFLLFSFLRFTNLAQRPPTFDYVRENSSCENTKELVKREKKKGDRRRRDRVGRVVEENSIPKIIGSYEFVGRTSSRLVDRNGSRSCSGRRDFRDVTLGIPICSSLGRCFSLVLSSHLISFLLSSKSLFAQPAGHPLFSCSRHCRSPIRGLRRATLSSTNARRTFENDLIVRTNSLRRRKGPSSRFDVRSPRKSAISISVDRTRSFLRLKVPRDARPPLLGRVPPNGKTYLTASYFSVRTRLILYRYRGNLAVKQIKNNNDAIRKRERFRRRTTRPSIRDRNIYLNNYFAL